MYKNILIIAESAGASGVYYLEQVNAQEEKRAITDDVNAATDGAFLSNCENVYVFDKRGVNILKENLDNRAKLIDAKTMQSLLEKNSIDAAFIIGAHAKNGTLRAFSDFTHNSVAWHKYTLNSKIYGDIGIMAVYLGYFNVPLVMVSGDRAACNEAKALISGIQTAEVKKTQIRNYCSHLNVSKARELIKQTAIKAVNTKTNAYLTKMPLNITVTFNRSDFADDCIRYHFGKCTRKSALKVTKKIEKVTVYSDLIF